MKTFINYFKRKALSITVVFLVMGLCVFNVQAQDDDDTQVWEHAINVIDLINKRVIIGDLEMTLTSGFKVFDRQGNQISRSVLQPGMLVSTTPQYSDSKIYISSITVME